MAQSDGVVRVNQFFVRFLPLRVAYAERLGSSAQWVMVMVVVVGVCQGYSLAQMEPAVQTERKENAVYARRRNRPQGGGEKKR